MPIDPLPQPPSRSDPQNFAARGDAFMAALPTFAAQANALQLDVNLKEEAATTAAISASNDAQAAALAAGDAQSSKNAAANSASEAQTARDAALGYRNDAAESALAAANSAASVDLANLSTDYFGPDEPVTTWPGMTWAHTTNPEMTEGYLKRRNAANTAWEVEGALFLNPGTDHAGPEPANTVPFMTWADTASGLLKRRNGANTEWVVEGVLLTNNSTGRLINVQVFDVAGSYEYIKTTGTKTIVAEVVGGGGGGGGVLAQSGSLVLSAGGGGGGGAWALYRGAAPSTPTVVTVGAQGIGLVGADGAPGGTSSLGALVSASGGAGGQVGTRRGTTDTMPVHSGGTAGGGGAAGGALVSESGSMGDHGTIFSVAYGGFVKAGGGGRSRYSPGGWARIVAGGPTVVSGNDADGYGGGGGGAIGINNGISARGGHGSPGLVIIWEYA